MTRILLSLLVVLVVVGVVGATLITRDGDLVTPQGAGTITVDTNTFEAFPLPAYAAKFVTDDYKSYFVEVEPGIKVHVLEVGSGFPVFLQHGNPTSGFLYRKVVAELPTDRVRVIMPTLVGLGFSSKVPARQHTLENHTRWINSVLVQLKLTELVYVGQDWGGPVGMGALALSPELLRGLVAMNTGFNAPTEPMDLSRAHATVKTPVVGELLAEVFGLVFNGLANVQNDPNSMPADVIDLYARPIRDSGNIKAPLALMRMVTDGPDHPSAPQMRLIENYVKELDVPAEIVWGVSDPILGDAVSVMASNFPNAPVTETQAGHFLQEEVPEEIAAALMRVVEKVQDADQPTGVEESLGPLESTPE